jgi:transcriptional regulator with AAA-type ATPase domain
MPDNKSSKNKNSLKNNQKVKWIITPGLKDHVDNFIVLFEQLKDMLSTKDKHLLISGATGVGKSLFTEIYKSLYKNDIGNRGNPVITSNIASLARNLIESELFGHVKGAFTGADKMKKGLLKEADGGILILEEIGDIPKHIQAKLLTFMETGKYRKVGDVKECDADVQIIGTTNKSKNMFRLDFWNRFFQFFVPPIYERREDVLYYLHHKYPDLLKSLQAPEILWLICHNWPGNVREIERIGFFLQWNLKIIHLKLKSFEPSGIKHYPYPQPFILEYTSMNILIFNDLLDKMKSYGINIDFLKTVLNEGNLRLKFKMEYDTTNKAYRPFKNIKPIKLIRHNDFRSEFDVYYFERVGLIDEAFFGFDEFCYVTIQNIFSNRNLIEFDRYNIVDDLKHWSPIMEIIDEPDESSRVESVAYYNEFLRQFVEFRAKKKIPDNIKTTFPESKPELIQFLENEHPEKLDILSLNEHEFLRILYTRQLQETNWSVKKAAENLKIDVGTFRSRLTKDYPDLLPKHRKQLYSDKD